MSCFQVAQAECSNTIDYSQVIAGDRIIPFVFELDVLNSIIDPVPGQNQRWCYRVVGVGENISTDVSLSHFVLAICPNITLNQITNVSVTIGGVEQTVVIGDNVELFTPPDTDPTTGCSGLKFDFGLNKVLGGENSEGEFCFELTTPFPEGPVAVCVKGGQVSSSALAICGPVCSLPPVNCETITNQLINVCAPVTITPFATVGTVTTECCGPATVSTTVPCPGIAGGSCTFFLSTTICVQVPVTFNANAVVGDTFVECGAAAAGECVCPPEV